MIRLARTPVLHCTGGDCALTNHGVEIAVCFVVLIAAVIVLLLLVLLARRG